MTKRIVAAAALLFAVAAVIVWSGAELDRAIDELDGLLLEARGYAEDQDFDSAGYYIELFQAALDKREGLFIAFSRRDMFYSIEHTAAAIESYNNEETYLDMLAELDRARSDLSILWKSTFRLI